MLVSVCVRVWLHCLVLHGWMGLLVGSLIISKGERGSKCVCERKRKREKERKGKERRVEMTALVNLPLSFASQLDDKGAEQEEEGEDEERME